jgi:hypothetical protein
MRTYRTEYRWNESVYSDHTYTDPKTGITYDLSHMKDALVKLSYSYKNEQRENVKGEIDAKIKFDHHCYTSEMKGDDDRPILIIDYYNDGSKKNRAFDLQRYNYSLHLPRVIKELPHKQCRESKKKGKAIRLEQQDRRNPRQGIYILLKTRINTNGIELFVETAHHRNNEPHEADLQKTPKRYMLILGDMLKERGA